MARARQQLVCVSETPYYHVTSRCVRRAFLCGIDRYSGKSFEHRRGWVEDRIRVLSSVFSIHICAYAVMSNHYHLVVRLDPDEPDEWCDDDVLTRWTSLFRGPLLVQRYRKREALTNPELDAVRAMAAVYRARLGSLSWFMKCLNEPIARRANAEDGCTGHFWEARFHSQALRSDRALVAAMAYVDLNPVRAGLATTPADADYTSLQARITGRYRANTRAGAVARLRNSGDIQHVETPIRPLLPFSPASRYHRPPQGPHVPIRMADYLALIDLAGRHSVPAKRGHIDPALEPVLQQLGLTGAHWAHAATAFRQHHRNGDLRPIRSA